MGYESDISGDIIGNISKLKQIREEAKNLFDDIDEYDLRSGENICMSFSGKGSMSLNGNGKYRNDFMFPFYEKIARLGLTATFYRQGEESGDNEKISIQDGKVVRFFSALDTLSNIERFAGIIKPFLKEPERAPEIVEYLLAALGIKETSTVSEV